MNFWFKIQNDFFSDLSIKMLLKSDEGARAFVFYMRLMCAAVGTAGVLEFRGIGANVIEEIALANDEPLDFAEKAIGTLTRLHLAELQQDGSLYLPQLPALTGSSKTGAERAAEFRRRKKRDATERNTDVTERNAGVTRSNVTECDAVTDVTQKSRTRKEKELDQKQIESQRISNSGSSPRAFGGAGEPPITLDDLGNPNEHDDGELPF